MARPKKNNADYFSHDNDMRNDDKILAIRRKFWHEWYSIWNMLLEKLCKSDWFIIDVDNVSLELLSWDFMIDPDELLKMIDYFCSIRLLCKIWDQIYSQKMIDRFNWLLSKRKRDIDYRERKQDDEVVIDVEKPQSKVKESKINNTISMFEVDSLIYKYFKRFETKDWQIWSRYSQLKDYCIENWHTIDIDWWTETIERQWDIPLVRRKKIKDVDWKFVNNKVMDVNAWESKAKRDIKNPLTTLYKFMKS